MSPSIFLLWLLSIPLFPNSSAAAPLPIPGPKGFPLNCGATEEVTLGDQKYIPDDGFTLAGSKATVKTPGLLPILSTLRFFPDGDARKYCYEFQVSKGGKYLVRTIYYYGGYDGGKEPPVFDQIVGGTKWATVNTTEDYAKRLSTYYEIIVVSWSRTLDVCLARNKNTTSYPFISAVVVQSLENSMYNSTDFNRFALTTVARNYFGHDGVAIGFPDDQYNRLWEPFNDKDQPTVDSKSNVTSSDFWNFPPTNAFTKGFTTSRGKTMQFQWPPFSLPATKYYVALYFQDNRTPSPYSWREFNVTVNGVMFYRDLNVTTKGVAVYASEWPLTGVTEVTLTPADDVPVGPIINAGEVMQLLPFGARTQTRDVIAMEAIASSFGNPPPDWVGDPCLPPDHSWTGVSCTKEAFPRVQKIELKNHGLTGTLSPNIANLTALTNLWLGGNELTGEIPDLGSMRDLQSLHLEDNQLEGQIPQSLGQLKRIHEIYLQNNDLYGKIPDSLQDKPGLTLQVTPGNSITT
ncbi:Putative leucine-rich repeat receptor-like serine/threonine-protein kinase At2g14440 [Linum perenne]